VRKPIVLKRPGWRAAGLAVLFGLGLISNPVQSAPASGGDTVQRLYDALLSTMKNGRTLGQSGRFTQLEPVILRTFDIPSMTRLSVGPSWSTLTEAQRQQVTESFGRYISAIGFSAAGRRLNLSKANGQRPGPGAGKRARGTPAEPHDPAGQPDRHRPRLLRTVRAAPAGPGGGGRGRRRATGNPTRPAVHLLPTRRRAVRRTCRHRLPRPVPGSVGRSAHRPYDDRPGARGV
jgi:hypothetical protein